MARILRGKEVADALTAKMQQDTQSLKEAGVTPTLCIFRVGERPDDLAYERGATKRAGESAPMISPTNAGRQSGPRLSALPLKK